MKEISVTKADLADGPSHNTDWIVVREDSDAFAALAAKHPTQVRDVDDPDAYGPNGATMYDFGGPI